MQHGMRAVGNVQKTGVKSHGATNIGLDSRKVRRESRNFQGWSL